MSSRFCKNCGAQLPEDAGFCEECGARAAAKPSRAEAPRKRGPKVGIIILIIVVVIAAVAVLLFSGLIGGEKPPEDVGAPSTQEAWQAPRSAAPLNTPAAQSTVAPAESVTQELPLATPAPAATPAPVVTEPPAPAATPAPAQMDATEKPTPEDFTWFTDKAGRWAFGNMPSDARLLGTAAEIGGVWKGMEMIYDYDGTVLGCGYFTLTLQTSSADVSVAATLDWHFIDWSDGGREDISSWQDDTLSGYFEVPTFAVGVPGNSIELYCYELDGVQYAEGIWTVQSGEEVRVALVRP